MHLHAARHSSTKFHKFVAENAWNDFVFGTVYENTNYLTEFKYKHPEYLLSHGEMIILSHLTHLESRVLEQSLITHFSEFNTYNVTFTSWDPATLD